ncbi:hypothetical protein ACI3PL_28415, partial [Lacticaseibacillus paracasei]
PAESMYSELDGGEGLIMIGSVTVPAGNRLSLDTLTAKSPSPCRYTAQLCVPSLELWNIDPVLESAFDVVCCA